MHGGKNENRKDTIIIYVDDDRLAYIYESFVSYDARDIVRCFIYVDDLSESFMCYSQLIYDAVKISLRCFSYLCNKRKRFVHYNFLCVHEKALEIVCGKITLRKSITFSFLFILTLSDFLLMLCFPSSSSLSLTIELLYDGIAYMQWIYGKYIAKEVENE